MAVIGAGAVGRMHIQRCLQHDQVCLGAIADPSPAARTLAAELGVPWFPDVHELLANCRPGGVVAGTPNATHAEVGIACIDQGLPVLVEKPVAESVAAAERLCAHAEARGVPLLVGHRRRHNPILRQARERVAGGALGRPVSSAVRGFEVEDTAAVTLRFACGALALPSLNRWRYRTARGWHEPLSLERTPVHRADPHGEQLRHFRVVSEGREAPLCSGRDGLRTLEATCAVHEAARTRQPVSLGILNPEVERLPCPA